MKRKIRVPDVPAPTDRLCWKQTLTGPHSMVRCDRRSGHRGLHSWETPSPKGEGKCYLIAAHPIQAKIVSLVAGKGIDDLSLRAIGVRVGVSTPQQVKHHLGQLVRYGFVDIVGGKYRIGASMRTSKRRRPEER